MFKEERNTSYPTSLFIDWRPLKTSHSETQNNLIKVMYVQISRKCEMQHIKNKSEKVDHTTF